MMSSSQGPQFGVVGVGASAGGLDALRALFSHMPDAPGLAFVVVVHLSPEHESHLVELLQPCTAMRVSQVTATTPIEPNHIYVIPPNANLDAIDTHLRLSELEMRRVQRAPIDHFLRTLAATHGEDAIGIILSGTGSDGALGIRQIREQGGLAVAQLPQEAQYAGMPESAIATGCIDLVLPIADMPGEIARYNASRLTTTRPPGDAPSREEALLLEKIVVELRRDSDSDVGMYRRGVLLQRVLRRMRVRHVSSLDEYLRLVRSHSTEAQALHAELLINVTEFFHDADTYRSLERVLDEILERRRASDERVRVWSIGCSTGEEAYSLAMLLIEKTSERGEGMHLHVFASELSPEALHRAREGVYPLEISASISAERLKRFFVLEGDRYRVRNDLRAMVTFSSHNLFRDPPYAHQDLVVCRNLLRDLEPEINAGVLTLLHYALQPHGVLFVDPRDNLEVAGLFERDARDPHILRRRAVRRRELRLPAPYMPFLPVRHTNAGGGASVADTANVYHAAIDRYVPASVLVDSNRQVVHFSSAAARYVRLPGGEPTLDILSLVPPVIGYQLNEGLPAIQRGAQTWRSERFAIEEHGAFRDMVISIDRVQSRPEEPGHLLIVFDDALQSADPAVNGGEEAAAAELTRLRSQVAELHTRLATAHNDSDGAKAVAERERRELTRATVEELENTREELQAVNEELQSIADENQHRMTKLYQLSDDLKHLLESTGLATLLLDRTLNITRFTPLAAQVFHIKPEDIGRPLSDLSHELCDAQLIQELRKVADELTELEREVENREGQWFLLRAQPYRSALRGVEGVVLVLLDITGRKRAEIMLRDADRHKNEFLAILAHELRNPLASIRAGVEVLRSPSLDLREVHQIAAVMRRQTQQLVRLVDDLLEVGRISTGKLELRIDPTHIADVIRDAVMATRPLIDSAHHRFATFISEEDLLVDGDAARLTQVVANLLTNAVRYTPPHGEISLTAERSGEEVLIRVKDNGRGISAQAIPHLFEMFYQERGGEGDQRAGLGIGLTLAKKLVEMHAGSIEASSAGPNRGSTFTMHLPLSCNARQTQATLPTGVTNGQQGHRILIVDDNMDAAESMCMLLTSVGEGDVRTAFSGEEALKLGPHLCPDVVLLDLGMPGMDGYEVARRIRREPWGRDILLVALTGWGLDQHRNQTKEAGFDRHLTKPAELEALLAVLNEHVH
jgi:two-component system, chemotaxis family, CheB/CheR fusion protein